MKSSFARVIPFAVSASLALLLAACGGGGGDGTSATATGNAAIGTASTTGSVAAAGDSPAVAGLDFNEFLGTWNRVDSATCHGKIAYGDYNVKGEILVITSTTAAVTETLYADTACTIYAGKLTENHTIDYSAGSVTGKTNVSRIQLHYTNSTTSTDGGSGLHFNKVPDGTQTGAGNNNRGLLDVQNKELYTSVNSSALDADGYPTQLRTTPSFQR